MTIKDFRYIFFTIVFLFLSSCESTIDNTALIEKEVNRKVNSLINQKTEKCRQNALNDAEVYVDSIISDITQNSINKGIDFPEKPEKKDTDSIGFKIEIDSLNLDEVIDSLKLIQDTTSEK